MPGYRFCSYPEVARRIADRFVERITQDKKETSLLWLCRDLAGALSGLSLADQIAVLDDLDARTASREHSWAIARASMLLRVPERLTSTL